MPTNAAVMIGNVCEVPLQVSHRPALLADHSTQATHDSGPLTVVLGTLSFSAGTKHTSTGSTYGDGTGRVQYHQLSILNRDLSVAQCILAFESSSVTASVSHELISRQKNIPGPIMGNDINRFIFSHDTPEIKKRKRVKLHRMVRKAEEQKGHKRPIQYDPWTLNMEWLRLEINGLLERKAILLHETLKTLHSDIEHDSDKELLRPKTL